MLRVSGIWISPAEIEDVLAGIRSISETRRCWAKAKSGWRRSCSISFRRPAATARLRWRPRAKRLSRALPPYKQPRRFEIAHDLPRTATGKVQRNKLREQLRRDPH